MLHSWKQTFRINRLPWAFSKHKPARCLGTTWRTTNLTMLRNSSQTFWFYDHHTIFFFRLLALFSAIKGLAFAALPWMLDLWNSRRTFFCGNMVFKTNSPGVTFAAVVLWFLDTVLFNIGYSFYLVLGFGHCPSQLIMSSHDLCMLS